MKFSTVLLLLWFAALSAANIGAAALAFSLAPAHGADATACDAAINRVVNARDGGTKEELRQGALEILAGCK